MCGNVGKCGGILWRVPRQQVALHLLVDSPTTQLPPTRPLSNYHANGNEEWDDERNCDSSEELLAKEFVNILRGNIELSKDVFDSFHPSAHIQLPMAMRIVMMTYKGHSEHLLTALDRVRPKINCFTSKR